MLRWIYTLAEKISIDNLMSHMRTTLNNIKHRIFPLIGHETDFLNLFGNEINLLNDTD